MVVHCEKCTLYYSTAAAVSKTNFLAWIDQMVKLKLKSQFIPFVNPAGETVPLHYMNIPQPDLTKIAGTFVLFSQWAHECLSQGISAGSRMQIEGSPTKMKYPDQNVPWKTLRKSWAFLLLW